MRTTVRAGIIFALIVFQAAFVVAQYKSPEDLARDAAIAEFTAKMKAANYPALFEKAAAEFNVPADILKGVAFTLTRWEHLQWPPGENFSPEHGKPRPFGIMSLWDNEFFGHSLIEAARLIGKTPDELKADAFQNMRGGAALLKKLYDETPKPEGTTAEDIESWRYAMAEYVGIPEPDLKHRFGVEVYEHMSKGYGQYGIEWKARLVNLGPMREDVKRIVAAEDAKREGFAKTQEQPLPAPTPPAAHPAQLKPNNSTPQLAVAVPAQDLGAVRSGLWWLVGVFGALLVGSLLTLRRNKKSDALAKDRSA